MTACSCAGRAAAAARAKQSKLIRNQPGPETHRDLDNSLYMPDYKVSQSKKARPFDILKALKKQKQN